MTARKTPGYLLVAVGGNLAAGALLKSLLLQTLIGPARIVTAGVGLLLCLLGIGAVAGVISLPFWSDAASPPDLSHKERNYIEGLILAVGVGLVFLALITNRWVAALIFPARTPLALETIQRIRLSQAFLGVLGIDFMLLARLIHSVRAVDAFVRRKAITNLLLAGLTLALPIVTLEALLRPSPEFYRQATERTPIFVRDPELGWRLRPNAHGDWGDVPVTINGKGLRGPELPYPKPAGVTRIIYLGDSVVFGYGIEDTGQTYPYLAETLLEDRLGGDIETINGGVGGYSPWQSDIWLREEGIKYDPDLIVVSFVLNDVTEKFDLVRYGGHTEGWQLAHTSSVWDWFLTHSAIVFTGNRLVQRARFGRDVQAGAQATELLDVRGLVETPNDPTVQQAWAITLENLGHLFDYAREQDIPVILVVFPYRFQLDDPKADPAALDVPQTVVIDYASEQGVPALDIFPMLRDDLRQEGSSPREYFLDNNHLTEKGHRAVAQWLADFILASGTLGE